MMFVKIIEAELGLKAVKEYQFHPTRKWRFDYAIPELMIAIEIEGGAWTQGRHTRGKGYIEDMEKYNAAVALGWRLLRFTPEQLKTVKPITIIEILLNHIINI